MFVVPNFVGGSTLSKEEQVSLNTGIGVKHSVGQTHYCMQVAFIKELFFEPGFHALTEYQLRRNAT